MIPSSLVEKLQPKEYYSQWIKEYHPRRPDARDLLEYRPVSIQTGNDLNA
jgi:exosome complex RNA-binding protein Rrp42 (RNase PH superfamily)